MTPAGAVRYDVTRLDDTVVHLFCEGTLDHAHRVLGARVMDVDGSAGVYFAVWAPNAVAVSVMGDFNGWNRESHPLRLRPGAGIWEGFVPGLGRGERYKYHVIGRDLRYRIDKADPYGIRCELPPETASIVWDLDYAWGDTAWMAARGSRQTLQRPMSVYEVHLGSWMRVPEDNNRSLTYREVAPLLVRYVSEMGFTHVELMPVMEHPFYGSWGYQITGYFAATSRYGTPQDLMYLVDLLHQNNIGVIFDWVPSHFPTDAHGLSYFDGTHLYEHADPRQGYHPDWKSYVFNYGRNEVANFLRSNALFWLEEFHADGLRVDAVASMLHLDFSRKEGEWVPNKFGGRENLEAVAFLQRLNEGVYRHHPDALTIAEDSTAWPLVSRPTYLGGLGFSMKWDMGWMHDSLAYFKQDPIHRRFHHQKVTFRMMYAYAENYVLPLSHDEVVHMKGSLLNKMSGNEWQRRANLRLLLGWQWLQPGKKLLFMGGEFGQLREWSHEASLDWHLLDSASHRGMKEWVAALNDLYTGDPAAHELDCSPEGFEWIDCSDAPQSVVSFLRFGTDRSRPLLAVFNFTPVRREAYEVGVPASVGWTQVLSSDSSRFGGSGIETGDIQTIDRPLHQRPAAIALTLPPLGVVVLRPTVPLILPESPLEAAEVLEEPTKELDSDR